MPGEDLLGRARRAGYRAGAISELIAQGDDAPAAVVESWRRRSEPIWRDISAERYRDLGVGIATLEGAPLYVFFLGVTSGDTFARRTESLRDPGRVRRELLEAVNRERAAHGLEPLRAQPLLERAAQAHADDMLARRFYGHASPEGAMASDRVRLAGYHARSVGENVARGQASVKEVMEDWMASPEHRRNILGASFRDAGFGIAIGTMPAGEQVLWVQVFGEPRTPDR